MPATREDIIAAKGADYVPMWGWTGTGHLPKYTCLITAEQSYSALVGAGQHRNNLNEIHRLYPGVKILYRTLRNRSLVVWLECWDDAAAFRLNTDETRWRIFCQCYNFMFAWTRQTGVAMDIVDFYDQYLGTPAADRDQQALIRPGPPVPRPMAPPRALSAVTRADRTSGLANPRTPAVQNYHHLGVNPQRGARVNAAVHDAQMDQITRALEDAVIPPCQFST